MAEIECATWNLRVFFMKQEVGLHVMKYALKHGISSKPSTVSFMEYLENLPDTSTANYRILHPYQKEGFFTKQEMDKLSIETSFEHFDVTLMYKLIQVGSENVEKIENNLWKWNQTLEGYVHTVSRTYNLIAFVAPYEEDGEEKYENKLKSQTKLFVNILEETAQRYNRPQDEFITEKDYILKTIADIEAKNYEELLQMWEKTMMSTFKADLLQDSKCQMQHIQYQAPVPYHKPIKPHVDVEKVFSKMTLKEVSDSASDGQGSHILDSLQVLSHIQPQGKQTRPRLLLVTGNGGSGKSAFLAHIGYEWMKEEAYCCMQGLRYYDGLLNFNCSFDFSTSLVSLFENCFCEMKKKYGSLLPILLKQCKILILIDDVNLRHHGNLLELVSDVLETGQNYTNLTVICTTRPESVSEFVATIPANFDTYHVTMLSIPFEERTDFVLKYYDWYTKCAGKDTTLIRKVIQDIGWKGHFQLPLNLVLLAKFFEENPDSVTTTLMQSKIHHTFYGWHNNKLEDRLNSLDVFADRHWLRYGVIQSLLNTVTHVAMKALNNERLYLSQEEIKELSDVCDDKKVPSNEVIETFCHLQQHVGPGAAKETQRFSFLDRGLQEFLAAMYTSTNFNLDMKKGEIKSMLKSIVKDSKLCPATQKNVLWHLSSILTYTSRAAYGLQEVVVNMIHDAGVNTCNEWLSLVEEADNSHELIRSVAHHMKKLPKNLPLDITDSTIQCATALLPLIPCRRVTITLSREPLSPKELMKAMPDYKFPDLHMKHHFRHAFQAMRWEMMGHSDLLEALQNHTCTQLLFKNQFRYPTKATPSSHLLHHQCWSHLESFEGYLHDEGLTKLPKGLKELSLAVAEENRAQSLLTTLLSTCESCRHLHSLVIHVPVTEVPPSVLVPLPCVPTVKLMLSDVNDEHLGRASRIAAALCPAESGYDKIVFPRSSLGVESWRQLMERLAEAGVKVKTQIIAVLDSLTDEESRALDTYAVSTMGCNFCRIPEDKMW